ncbi:GtrA family protein [Vibrio sp. JPW-9-11-11]|uniref:GtrA family protein n=1 Tax=Vibrio sp. JPW-9-11-11 TaxID=1416532 RepID=UPI0015942EC5|nr:GtrA family protein [Vibrio sp. JPW-9-11-11]NVD06349.1 GtrA family protein [Vibrio sp. JPW-9-11-11]
MNHAIVRFACVGSVGFVVDAAVFSLCFYLVGIDPFAARVVAFFCAATVTWYGNRRFTFANSQRQYLTQWLKFLSGATVSALPNLAVFKALWLLLGGAGLAPIIALAAGVLAGMVSNYLISRRWVFKPAE